MPKLAKKNNSPCLSIPRTLIHEMNHPKLQKHTHTHTHTNFILFLLAIKFLKTTNFIMLWWNMGIGRRRITSGSATRGSILKIRYYV
jgi:hypothetical protein